MCGGFRSESLFVSVCVLFSRLDDRDVPWNHTLDKMLCLPPLVLVVFMLH